MRKWDELIGWEPRAPSEGRVRACNGAVWVMVAGVAALAACAPADTGAELPTDGPPDGPAAGTRPADQPNFVTVEGRFEQGVECPTIRTPDGEVYALGTRDPEFETGDYVAIRGEVADASFCQEGEGTLIVDRVRSVDPPARDRDPARAGGLAVTSDYVRGSWVAKGAGADCQRPDFQVTRNRSGGSIIETRIDGVPATGYVDVGEEPALRWDQGIPTLPIQTRGPDGLAVMPARDRPPVTLAGHRIEGDGVVFIKCA